MTIQIYLGSVGSGKTANCVREIYLSKQRLKTYSNIKTTLKNQIDIDHSMIVKKELVDTKTKRSGETIPVYDFKLNVDYWKSIKEPISVIIDEAHSIINSRRSMSKINIIMSDWLALIRRVLGESDRGAGDLILITQLPNRVDVIARDMCTLVKHHICHYQKSCLKCGYTWQENSEMPEKTWDCASCHGYRIKKHSHIIEVKHFAGMSVYEAYQQGFYNPSSPPWHKHYFINDIEDYFPKYDTLAWDNMFGDLY